MDTRTADVKVILFSKTKASDTIIENIETCFKKEFKSLIYVSDGEMYRYMFEGTTGLDMSNTHEKVFEIKNCPAYIFDDRKDGDSRLTNLEGQIGLALIKSNISDVSLIAGPHGVYDENSLLFYVGLCWPSIPGVDRTVLENYYTRN